MRALRRGVVGMVVAAGVLASASVATPSTAGAAPAGWKVGDCFATADVDADAVDLTSRVACTKEHAVQVVGGAALPKALADAGLDAVLASGTPERSQLIRFMQETCAPGVVAKHVYPAKAAKQLATLFDRYDVAEWMAPAAGQMGWVLPDADAFAAGATDLLCVYIPNPEIHGTTKGDLRKISTRDPLATLRLCADFRADGNGSEGVLCDEVHDIESLLWVALDVTGKPTDVRTWTDDDWQSLDDTCTEFATAVIGAERKDIVVNADTDPGQAPIEGTRFFNCRAFPKAETDAFPGGVILTGAGNARIRFTDT